MELLPRFNPSTIPAAIASTFFSAPAISTPVTSLKLQVLQESIYVHTYFNSWIGAWNLYFSC